MVGETRPARAAQTRRIDDLVLLRSSIRPEKRQRNILKLSGSFWSEMVTGDLRVTIPLQHSHTAGVICVHTSHTDSSSHLILVFCGPHDLTAPRGVRSPVYNRIDHGIRLALERDAPLVVLGDAFGGVDVAEFASRARAQGLNPSRVYEYFREPSNTRLEVTRTFAWLAVEHRFPSLRAVHFVTDGWHLPRVLAYAHGEVGRFLAGRSLDLVGQAASGGVAMSPEQLEYELEREARGIMDYLSGRPHTPRGEPRGRPEHVSTDLAQQALDAIAAAVPLTDPT